MEKVHVWMHDAPRFNAHDPHGRECARKYLWAQMDTLLTNKLHASAVRDDDAPNRHVMAYLIERFFKQHRRQNITLHLLLEECGASADSSLNVISASGSVNLLALPDDMLYFVYVNAPEYKSKCGSIIS